jgi:hypothetical protein
VAGEHSPRRPQGVPPGRNSSSDAGSARECIANVRSARRPRNPRGAGSGGRDRRRRHHLFGWESKPPGPAPRDDVPALADFAEQLRGMIKQLKSLILPRQVRPRDSSPMIPAETPTHHDLRPGQGRPGPVLPQRRLLTSALWRGRMLLGDHIDKIERCGRWGKFFIVRKRAKFCKSAVRPECPRRAVHQKPEPDKRKRLRQRDCLQRLRGQNPDAADRCLSRLQGDHPSAARWLKIRALHGKTWFFLLHSEARTTEYAQKFAGRS